MTPQEKLVIDYIQQRGSITSREASKELGIDRLASRISDLRKGGVNIVKEWEYGRNRRGKIEWGRGREAWRFGRAERQYVPLCCA